MIPGLHLFPSYSPTLPCETLACGWRSFPVTVCAEAHCPFMDARRAEEDRTKRDRKDEKEKGQ